MRSNVAEIAADALDARSAAPALTAYDTTSALGAIHAAEDAGLGIILLVAPRSAASRGGLELIGSLRVLADAASVPVAVQLDHAKETSLIAAAVDAGADSVLADGSALPLDDNIAFVSSVVALVAQRGVPVEAELGHLAGDEDRAYAVEVGGFTDVGRVSAFVRDTGAALFAPAVGNAHGLYTGVPELHWELLDAIRDASPVPLVLHGASGIGRTDLARSAAFGIGKVNFNTELRTAILGRITDVLPSARADGEDMLAVLGAWHDAAYGFVSDMLALLGGPRRAP
ncbi:class II fructose-bisphosphate aldolase [Galbitalea sp. SE-J8]|uniref:class II fructose-bisphosphate aldolase n=1 Tax=Galbitalea sp. SE-J8 TaxID=3054952 RepID=UPI00259CF42B|nr:class II fructose-bisphosphate aldolase [Galbitalea sp. SE-J8]MDM4763007.1 class II fructose-bisphosphate aldolase [Galbitalea sp. SE-J8]